MLTIVLIIIIVLIVDHNHKKKQKLNQGSEEIQRLNDEITAELDKSEPDYEKIKTLHAEIENLKSNQSISSAEQNALPEPEHGNTSSSLSEKNVSSSPSADSNVNGLTIALYVGSLLILAGVGGLVFSGAKTFGLILLSFMTIVFYGGGIMLRKSKTLKMPSYVFVGTGMMMLPFLGILIYDITKIDANLIWLFASLVGIPMFVFAAYIMESKVFSYFVMVAFVSLSCSLAQVMSLALVWYFVFVMIVGIVLEILSIVGIGKNLGVMQESIRQTGQWLPLVTFVASLMAIAGLNELDYVIILSVTLLHLIIEYIFSPNIIKENLLRLILPAWAILFAHFLIPESQTIGVMLSCVALAQIILVLFKLKKVSPIEKYRKETETGCTIVVLISFIIAGICLGTGNITTTWAWVSIGLAIDSFIIFLARHAFGQDAWFLGLLVTGIALPLTVINALGLKTGDFTVIYMIIYLLEIFGMNALFWRNNQNDGDISAAVSTGVLGVAAIAAGWSDHLTAIPFFVVALSFWLKGVSRKNNELKEVAIYSATIGTYFVIDWLSNSLGLQIDYKARTVLIGHLALIGCIITSLLWDNKNNEQPHARLLIGCIALLIAVGGIAISGALWAMYLFMVETVGILLAGVIIKDSYLRIAGTVGAFLAVLWFTKDLSFVWPIVLGLGIIGVVVYILIKNNRSGLPKPPKSS